MFTSVLMIEKPLTSADVEFVTTPARRRAGLLRRAHAAPRRPGDRLLRAIDDVALGELDEAGQRGRGAGGPGRRRTPPSWRSQHSLDALRAAGSEAAGQVVEDHPLDQLKAVVDEVGADEVIVLTAPHYVEEFFHRDWASRARHKVGVPVLKLFAHSE